MNPDRGSSSPASAALDLPESSGKRTKKAAATSKGSTKTADSQAAPDQYLPYQLTSKTLTIYVTKVQSNPNIASFTTKNQAGTTTAGVVLNSSTPNVNVTVNWMLGEGIASLTSLVTSDQFQQVSGDLWSLTFTTPTASAAIGIPFLVNFDAGAPHDPQVIITPISGGQQAKQAPAAKRAARKAPKPVARKPAKAKAAPKRKGGKKR